MPYDLIVKGGTVVSASDTYIADIGVVAGKVVSVGKIAEPAKRVVDARGKVVIPGGIDAHTHFDMPFMGATTIDDFTTGSTSAIFGESKWKMPCSPLTKRRRATFSPVFAMTCVI